MNIQSMLRHALFAATCSAALCAAPQAHATFVVNGYANGSESFGITSPVATGTFSAGGFIGAWNGITINFWCTELNEYITFGHPYTNYSLGALNTGALSKLFYEVGGSAAALTTTDRSAALQLAVWEIVYESGPYNLGTGAFKVTSGNAAARTLAQGWLNGLGSVTGQANLFVLPAVGNQNQIGGGPPPPGLLVPEPAMLPLLGVGLLAVVFAVRRRSGVAIS